MVVAAALYALSNIANKKYAKEESILSMLFYPSLFGLILSGYFATPYWTQLSLKQIGLSVLLGMSANLILFCIISAYKKIDATFLAPLQYFELVPSIFLGILFFNENISSYTIFGAIIIIVSTLCIFYEKIDALHE
jgi:drug/metabolite transporter (DMT)-like permease